MHTFIWQQRTDKYHGQRISAALLFDFDEIWISGRIWPSEDSDDNKYEAGSSTKLPRPPFWNCIWRHYSAAGDPIWTKFNSVMQNSTQITVIWSTQNRQGKKNSNMADVCLSKPEVYNSAVDLGMSTKFGLRVNFGLRKRVTPWNTKSDIVLRRRGHHLEKSICHIFVLGGPIWM